MATNQGIQHQLRRGTNAQMQAFAGAAGEPTVDTDFMNLVINNGTTIGGYYCAMASFTQFTGSTARQSIPSNVSCVMCFPSTGAIVVVMPSFFPLGRRLFIGDFGGTAGTNNITVVAESSAFLLTSSTGGTSTSAKITTNGGHLSYYGNATTNPGWMWGG